MTKTQTKQAARYVYAQCYGGVWRLSKTNWKRYLLSAANGAEPDLNDYGKMLTVDAENVTDLDEHHARYLYDKCP